ncbi:MAG: hypothetical protein P8166_04520 [Candidatus Thiodiazotropha sp.]
MSCNFNAFDLSCRVVCYLFVYKAPKSRSTLTIASRRREIPAWKRVS